MQTFKKEFFGTILNIGIQAETVDESLIDGIFQQVEIFEKKYSRFIEGNYLWSLNTDKKAPLTPEIQTILNLGNKLNELSDGYFDITILPYLENIGYGIAKNPQKEVHGMKNIIIENNEIILKNNISLDLGGIGKGYMIDVIFHELSKTFSQFVINFGGDIRVAGRHTFTLEDPIDSKKSLGTLSVNNSSLAGSGGHKRTTSKGHHLIDIKKGQSENEKLAVYVTHKVASLADGFATTLFVSPLETCLNILKKVQGLEGLIIMKNGEMYQTKGFNLEK